LSEKKLINANGAKKHIKLAFSSLLSFLYNVGKLERRFYKAKNGEFPLNPQMQVELLEIFKERGADLSLGFDSYEEQDVLVEK